MGKALELIELGHGLLRELPDARLWGVDDGALVLGEDATHFVFCYQGAVTIRQSGAWPHVLTAGMYASAPGKCEVRPVGQDLSRGIVISRHRWLGMMSIGGPQKQIQKRLGMESEEVVRLVNRAGMPTQVRKVAAGLNKAWVPGKG